MLRTSLLTFAVALAAGAGLSADAQQNARESEATRSTQPTMVHYEGCVFPKRALSSSTPVLVPAGSVEDYVLTHASPVPGTPAATPTAHAAYELQDVGQERLRALTGKRVGVTGRVDAVSSMPRFRVTTIREIQGTCPITPSTSQM